MAAAVHSAGKTYEWADGFRDYVIVVTSELAEARAKRKARRSHQSRARLEDSMGLGSSDRIGIFREDDSVGGRRSKRQTCGRENRCESLGFGGNGARVQRDDASIGELGEARGYGGRFALENYECIGTHQPEHRGESNGRFSVGACHFLRSPDARSRCDLGSSSKIGNSINDGIAGRADRTAELAAHDEAAMHFVKRRNKPAVLVLVRTAQQIYQLDVQVRTEALRPTSAPSLDPVIRCARGGGIRRASWGRRGIRREAPM